MLYRDEAYALISHKMPQYEESTHMLLLTKPYELGNNFKLTIKLIRWAERGS